MSDLIRREDAYKIAKKVVEAVSDKQYSKCLLAYDIMDWIDDIPAVDAVEVVRCRECKHWETDWEPNYFNPDNPMYYCAETDIFPSGNWFCADGQRREEEDDG